jgi:uncharacterized protein (TIGR02413 family)
MEVVIVMTLNIFFISITLKKRKESLQQATRNETIEKLFAKQGTSIVGLSFTIN